MTIDVLFVSGRVLSDFYVSLLSNTISLSYSYLFSGKSDEGSTIFELSDEQPINCN